MQELFRNAMQGMYQVLGPKTTRKCARRACEIRAGNREDLLVDFLNELLAYVDLHREVYQSISFEEHSSFYLRASLRGRKIKGFSKQIKGATHHDLSIVEKGAKFEATIVFDV